MRNNLKIFHTNINGLESKFDILHELVSNGSSDLDILSITETSHKNEEFFYHKRLFNTIYHIPRGNAKLVNGES